jgi:hypothetical protein
MLDLTFHGQLALFTAVTRLYTEKAADTANQKTTKGESIHPRRSVVILDLQC